MAVKPNARKEAAEAERIARENFLIMVGGNVKLFRERRYWTQDKLAEQAHISCKYIHDIERGKKCISIWVLRKIARAMDVEIGHILSDNADIPEHLFAYADIR